MSSEQRRATRVRTTARSAQTSESEVAEIVTRLLGASRSPAACDPLSINSGSASARLAGTSPARQPRILRLPLHRERTGAEELETWMMHWALKRHEVGDGSGVRAEGSRGPFPITRRTPLPSTSAGTLSRSAAVSRKVPDHSRLVSLRAYLVCGRRSPSSSLKPARVGIIGGCRFRHNQCRGGGGS